MNIDDEYNSYRKPGSKDLMKHCSFIPSTEKIKLHNVTKIKFMVTYRSWPVHLPPLNAYGYLIKQVFPIAPWKLPFAPRNSWFPLLHMERTGFTHNILIQKPFFSIRFILGILLEAVLLFLYNQMQSYTTDACSPLHYSCICIYLFNPGLKEVY